MKVTIWGSRGSLPAPSPDNNEFGGNTSCVQVTDNGTMLVLDAGSGIRRLSYAVPDEVTRVDILLTHLHLDHIMGLGFFLPLYKPEVKVNIWGPSIKGESLHSRLTRYLSPPLFPIRLQDLPCRLELFEIDRSEFQIGDLTIHTDFVCHPGPTVGYRIENEKAVLAYVPDHEPALGSSNFPNEPQWTSGYELAYEADLLLHDAQYTREEYEPRVGWGHSSMEDALKFAEMSKVKKFLFFHHDPAHTDVQLRSLFAACTDGKTFPFETGIAREGDSFWLPEGRD